MAQIVEIITTSGLTLSAKLFLDGSDTVVATADSVTESINRLSVYLASFSGVSNGIYLVIAFESGTPVTTFYVKIDNSNGIWTQRVSPLGFESIETVSSIGSGGVTSASIAANAIGSTQIASDALLGIASAVWQDSSPSDFSVASSIGKSLYTSGIIPGAAGGLFIAGTNAATTVTTSFTTTFTGNLTGSIGSVTSAVSVGTISTDAISAAAVSAAAVSKIQLGLSTYSGGDTSGTTTLLSRLTSTRAGYLDNLSGGAIMLASSYTAPPTESSIATAVWSKEISTPQLPGTAADFVQDTHETSDRLSGMLEVDGLVYRWTSNSLEQSPTGASAVDTNCVSQASVAGDVILDLGDSQSGLTLTASVLNSSGDFVVKDITDGFVEFGQGNYGWTYNFLDDFRGYVVFYEGTVGSDSDFLSVSIKASVPVSFKRELAVTVGSVFVDHDYGGQDNLSFLDNDNQPISEAIVDVFLSSNWEANLRSTQYRIASVMTDVHGHWKTGVNLDPGEYTLLYYKPGHFNPTTVDLTVTE